MRRLAAAAVFIATIGALAALPSNAKPPAPTPLSVSITSGPSNPTTSTNATFGFTIGGAPTSTECRQSAGAGDRFTRSGALGSADAGGAWTAPSAFSTDGQLARVVATAATTRTAVLGASLADADVSARVSLAAVPTGNPAGALVAARISGSDYFGSRLIVQPGGQVRVQLVRSLAGLENVLASAGVGSKYKAGQVFWLRLRALDSTIQAKAWTNGKVEPASWQLSIVDPTPLAGGSIGFGAYGAAGLSNQVEVVTDDFSAINPNAMGSVAPCPGGSAAYGGLALGGHVFRVRASAASEQVTSIYPWTINPPAPTVTLTSTPTNPTTDTSASFAWTTTGIVDSTTCSLDGSTAPCSSSTSYTNLAPGEHSFKVDVTNAGGTNSASHLWTILSPAPTVTITKGPESGTPETTATFEWTTTGEVDATNCELDVDDPPPGALGRRGTVVQTAGISTCSSPVTYTDLAPGPHIFKVTVRNAGGSTEASYLWMIAEPAPTVTITSGPSDGTFSTSGSFTYTISDPNATPSCELDGSQGNITSCDSAGSTVSGLQPGPHTFTISAQNDTGTGSADYSWTIGLPDADIIPIAVPETPVSAAAVFYNEATGGILSVNYFCEKADVFGLPPGLSGWTTLDPNNPSGLCSSWATLNVEPATGVAIATSFRPACTPSITTSCFEDSGFATVNNLCRQGGGLYVQCSYATGAGAAQDVVSGLQFIRGYSEGSVSSGPPELRSAWLQHAGCTSGTGSGYFASGAGDCTALLSANLDLGAGRTATNTEMRYRIVDELGSTCDYGAACGLTFDGQNWSAPITVTPQSARYAVAVRIRLRQTTVAGFPACSNSIFNNNCTFYYTASGVGVTSAPSNAAILASPLQRTFMGNLERSRSVKFLRLIADRGCNGSGIPDGIDGEAASQPLGQQHCFAVDMGLDSANVAASQDEPPLPFGVPGASVLDCDPAFPNVVDEIVNGCGVPYAPNGFQISPPCPSLSSWGQMESPPPPYNTEWPPYTCVLTQAPSSPAALVVAFNERVLGDANAPSCPPDAAGFVAGRNYWSDANNDDDTWAFPNLNPGDPRIVRLPALPSSAFSGSGNEMHPIASIFRFYITGWGMKSGSGTVSIEDPCPGNTPPPDLPSTSGFYFWGHVLP